MNNYRQRKPNGYGILYIHYQIDNGYKIDTSSEPGNKLITVYDMILSKW